MSATLSSALLSLTPMLTAGGQDLGVVLDADGTLLLRQLYFPAEQLLYVQWFGNLTAETVVTGAHAVLQTQKQLRFPLLLNDKHQSTGDWAEAMEWLEFEWLPQAQRLGLQAFAYVFAPDLNSQFSSQEFVARCSRHLSIRVFYDTEAALAWLLAHLSH